MTTATAKRPRVPEKRVPEKNIQETCDDFLALDGWRKIVTDPPHLRGLGVTERGIADRLYIRYGGERPAPKRGWAEVLWIEWKRKGKGGKAAQHQKDWHAAERARGALVWLAGEDFPATIEGFQAFYLASGLNRRLDSRMLTGVPLGRRQA